MRGRALLFVCALIVSVLTSAFAVRAETYPLKPVTLVVPAAPGGVTDIVARALAQRLSERFGKQVIVENRPGASNQIGAENVAKAEPDGYTMLVSAEATFVVNPWLYRKLTYDPAKDFVPITGLVSISQSLIVTRSLPANNLRELIALAKRRPGELNYGTYGIGSTGHLNMEMLQRLAGIKLAAIHYKGATPALTDVMAGHIQLMFISSSAALEPAQAGKVKLIAAGGRRRLAQAPDVPTVAESGFPGFEAVSWFGLFAPARTPRGIVQRVNAEVRRVFDDLDFQEKFLAPNLYEPMVGTPEEFAAFIKAETQKWGELVRAARIKAD